uniref:Gamma-glutamylcyclotransferase AIG2-like domain-containing protein n=1 Tax=Escherichia phage 1-6bf TaxID=3117708 RepID=A0AAU6NU80_9CAUD
MSEVIYVATYGSLRRGQANYLVNDRAGAKSIGEGWTEDNFDLFRYGGSYFPSISLTHSNNNKPVRVEVFATDKAGLEGPYDRLEGYNKHSPEDSFYQRTQIAVKMDSGETVIAWIYHIDKEQDVLVESGDWSEYLKSES